ncbi:MAG: cardiolipin synthase [Alistipes sp.]
MSELLTALLFGIYAATTIGIILVVITDNRNPLKTTPWILILTFIPLVGILCYFFFGQNLSKRRIITHRTRKRITTYPEQAKQAGAHIPDNFLPLVNLLIHTIHAAPFYGSRLTPYVDGTAKMEALLEEIARAQDHIHLQYYIFADDQTGRRLQQALIAKAREGIEVRILYDDVGCNGVKRAFFDAMRDEGIAVHAFLHVRFPLFTSKVNYRNHCKIVVVDGRVGFFGGMNIADRYVKDTAQGAAWRDTHFKLEGSAVHGLQASFLSDWSATTRIHLSSDRFYPAPISLTDNLMQIVTSGPFGQWRVLLQAVSFAFANAKRRIWIETPYFLPTEALQMALQTAALGDIDVRLMLPARSDSKVVGLASHSFLDAVIRAGVKVSFYTPGFLHSKLLLIDDDLSMVGSANMDFRSFEHNFEIDAFIYDRAFNARLTEIYLRDLDQCQMIVPAQWLHRSRGLRLAESCMRLFSPLL